MGAGDMPAPMPAPMHAGTHVEPLYMHIIMLEMLLAVVKLQQLPLLLLLKLHVHKICSGAAAAAVYVVRHHVPDDASC